MAEFTEVMKHKKRLCKYQINKWSSDNVSCCTDCPLSLKKRRHCDGVLEEQSQEAEAIIMKWAEEHPIKTNADKFKEVFGYEVSKNIHSCNAISHICIGTCDECEINGFWLKEYKEPSEEK